MTVIEKSNSIEFSLANEVLILSDAYEYIKERLGIYKGAKEYYDGLERHLKDYMLPIIEFHTLINPVKPKASEKKTHSNLFNSFFKAFRQIVNETDPELLERELGSSQINSIFENVAKLEAEYKDMGLLPHNYRSLKGTVQQADG